MDRDQFWKTVDRSRRAAGDDEGRAAALATILATIPAAEIEAFAEQQAQLMQESHSWDLWGAAFVINGGCSDDGFDYFRGWLMLRGRRAWERALRDPQSLTRVASEDSDNECETVLYAAARAYEQVAGKPIPFAAGTAPREPAGDPWEEDDLPRRYPKLWRRFGQPELDPELLAAANAEADAQRNMRLGMEAQQQGRLAEALEHYTFVRKNAPRDTTRMLAANNMAWTHLLAADPKLYPRALELAEQAVGEERSQQRHDFVVPVTGTMALALIRNGRHAEGLQLLAPVLANEDTAAWLKASHLYTAAIGHAHLGDREQARQLIVRGRALDPDHPLLAQAEAEVAG